MRISEAWSVAYSKAEAAKYDGFIVWTGPYSFRLMTEEERVKEQARRVLEALDERAGRKLCVCGEPEPCDCMDPL